MEHRCSVIFSTFLVLVVICGNILNVRGGYLITTPRRWTAGENSQVCVSFTDKLKSQTPSDDVITVEIKSDDEEPEELLKSKDILVMREIGSQCSEILLPSTKSVKKLGNIFIRGSIEGSTFNYTKPITIATDVAQTYVQTDKFLYKPSQTVQFRILTVIGPKLRVSLENYEEIWVENPSGSRIAQWLDVANEKGLIHMKLQLTEEPEEGSYKIQVRTPYKETVSRTFKVEEYVLPRYKVTIKPPKYILGTAESFEFKVCAKYTFGQPVKGNLTLTLDNGGWGNYRKTVIKQSEISGCHKIEYTSRDLNLNSDDYYSYSLKATAVVIEEGTDVKLDAKSASIDVSRTALSFNDLSIQKYYKPELPFIGEIKVSLPGDTPAPNEPMNVCARSACRNLTTNDNGILKFIIPPHIRDNVIIKAINYPHMRSNNSWRSIMYESSFYKSLHTYHSPSNSSLVVALTEDKIECTGKHMEFEVPVRYSAVDIDSALVNAEVVSRGQIIFSSSQEYAFSPRDTFHLNSDLLLEPLKEPTTKNAVRGTFTIPVSLSSFASPKAKIVVWYVRPDGEVVSDSRKIDITDCLRNNVKMMWNVEKVQPGDEATLNLVAAPDSLCSLGVVDKSVELLSSKNNDLSVTALLEVASRSSVDEHENRQVNDFEYCRSKQTEGDPPPPPILPPVALPAEDQEEVSRRKRRTIAPFWPFYSDDVDALHMFDEAGLYAFSDLTLETRPCRRRPEISYESSIDVSGDATLNEKVRPGEPIALASTKKEEDNPLYLEDVVGIKYAFSSEPEFAQPPNPRPGQTKVSRIYFPETWIWGLFSITSSGSLEETVTLPDTITEWVGRAVCVHPTEGVGISEPSSITTFRDFFIDLTLPPSVKRSETFPVKISVFNYLNEHLPLKIILESSPDYDILSEKGDQTGSGERSSCLAPEDKTVHSIRIRPKALGDVNITIEAFVDTNSLDVCGVGTGKARSDRVIKPIRVELEGFPKEKAWSKYICISELESRQDSFEPWKIEAPPSIVKDSIRTSVGVVGDLMGPTIENLGKLVRMPYGCGEQNMLNFAPTIFVMRYLESTGEKSEKLASDAIEFMEKGYQRELNYRHKDGSFSAFGQSDDSGSTWLTAFVLKSFAQARNYISIDNGDLEMSKNWLKLKQMENGCFDSVGKVLHKGMKGGIAGSDSPSLLSSFVLIALLEAGDDPGEKSARETLFCLKSDKENQNAYIMAVKAYALALAKSPDTEEAIASLLSSATENSATMYWKFENGIESSRGVGVETAGYAALAILTFDPVKQLTKVRKIIKWINNARNGQGGFISTQDTIVALQALAMYESNMKVEELDFALLVSNEGDTFNAQFKVNEKNKLLQQVAAIPSLPTTLTFEATGSGCTLIQAILRYNVPEPDASDAFKLRIETATEPDKACKTKRVKACVSYVLPDLKSNMGIIEVNLVSGYIPHKGDLKQLIGYGTGLFKRYEVDGNVVTIYIDEFSAQEICVNFRIIREIDVEDLKPGSVKVYDYYKPEYFVSEKYELPSNEECKDEKKKLPFEEEIIVDEELEKTTISPDEEVFARFIDAMDKDTP